MEFLEIVKVILLGILEGITEWLPVSSTGHIKLFDHFWTFSTLSDDFMSAFDYVVQLGAILAVVVLFWNKLFPLGTAKAEEKTTLVWKKDVLTMWLKIIVACVPALLAIVVDEVFENLDERTEMIVISATLILYGIAFLIVETIFKKVSFFIAYCVNFAKSRAEEW